MVFDEELNKYIHLKQEEVSLFADEIKEFNHRSEYYKIKNYLDDFIEDKHVEDRFIVMPGLRGLGKTTILFQLYNYLVNEKDIKIDSILYLSMDEINSVFGLDLLTLVDNFLKITHKTTIPRLDKKIFIFVDESHFDKNWAVSGKIIYDKTKNIFLICTDSSAIDLEINEEIARKSVEDPRLIKESIFPNNFNDYLLLKYDFKISSDFSTSLKNVLYYGDENYVEKAVNLEKEVYNNLFDLKKDIDIEFIEFLKSFGFPLTLNYGELRRYRRNLAVVTQVIDKDIPRLQSFDISHHVNLKQIIAYLANKREGRTLNQIVNSLSISPKIVNELLNLLEKTQLIFPIKPYDKIEMIFRDYWKYYFLSPTITSAINHYMGKLDLDNRTSLEKLAETFVASTLFKISQNFHSLDIFYLTGKKTSDFIIKTKFNNLIPIEVQIAKKTKNQLTTTMNKYGADKGILISNRYSRIRYENNILYLPLISFGFI